jgi:hypothetical protein
MNDSVDEREARVGRTEAVIRAVNDQIEDLDKAFAIGDEEFAIVCECGQMECVEQIQIVRADYARVRTDLTLFLVVPGHEDPTVEVVVESGQAGYVVVRKPPGTPAEIAANTAPLRRDPRERRRRNAINSIADQMRENGMSSEDDFLHVRQSMLPDRAEDFLASGLLSISWRDVRIRLEEIS